METLTSHPPVDDPRRPPATATSRRVALASRAGDAMAVVVLLALTWWSARHDGASHPYDMARAGWVVLVLGVPVAAAEMRRLGRLPAAGVLAWGLGLAMSFAFAAERSGFVRDLLVFTAVPLCALCAHRVWRRPWGPAAVLVLLLITAGQYFYDSFLTWWGDTLRGRSPRLRPLSWHNQSGMVMGALGLLFLGPALMGRRVAALAGVLLGGACLAGAWLAGSRGAAIATAVGIVAAATGAVRAGGWRRAVLRSTVVAAVAVVVVSALTGMAVGGDDSGGGQPLLAREESAAIHLRARLWHMSAAAQMFADRPLVGHGPGSYRVQALRFTPPHANLTSSAHNEFVEVAGEGGIVPAAVFAAFHGAVLWAAARRLRRPLPDGGALDLRRPLVLGAAAAVPALTLHAAADFDWGFPAIPVLLGIAAVAVSSRPVPRDRLAPRAVGVAVVPLVVLLIAGIWGQAATVRASAARAGLTAAEFARSAVPWDASANVDVAVTLSRRGEHDLATQVMAGVLRWNPGVDQYRTVADVVAYRAGRLPAAALVEGLGPAPAFYGRNLAADALIERGDLSAAEEVVDETLAGYPTYEAWGVHRPRSDTWVLKVRLAAGRGCEQARAAAAGAVSRGAVTGGDAQKLFAAPLRAACQ